MGHFRHPGNQNEKSRQSFPPWTANRRSIFRDGGGNAGNNTVGAVRRNGDHLAGRLVATAPTAAAAGPPSTNPADWTPQMVAPTLNGASWAHLASLDPAPTRSLGAGAGDLVFAFGGLRVGSDNKYGATRCGGEYHPGICFLPY
jgi:hypothetical protein